MKPKHKEFILKNIGEKSVQEISRELNLRERNVQRFLESKGLKPGTPVKVSYPQDEVMPAPKEKRSTHIFFIAAIFTLVLAAYFNALHNDFIWDDQFLIRDNFYIKNFRHFFDIFKTTVAFSSGNVNNFYRPIQELSYMIDYSFWGYHPFGFHLTNIILHGLCAIAVYFFSLRVLKNGLAAFIAGALFGIHPINTEAVTYVAGRADSLFLLFLLSSFILFLKSLEYLKKENRLPLLLYTFSIFFYILSILSKEMGLILPALLLLYLWTFYSTPTVRYKLSLLVVPFGAVMFLYALARKTILNFSHAAPAFLMAKFNLAERLLIACKAFCDYLYLFIVPLGLHMERSIRFAHSIVEPKTLGAVSVMGILVAFIGWSYKHSRKVFFAGMWFLIGLLPVSNIIPINSFMAEHWVYLPSIGIYMVAGLGVANIFYRDFSPRVSAVVKMTTIIILSASGAYFCFLTFQRNKDWKDEIIFFKNTLRYTPDNARLHLNFGNTYNDRGQIEEAIQEYKKTIELDPNFMEAYFDLAHTYFGLENYTEAKKYVEKTLTLKPDLPQGLQLLALIKQQEGDTKEAERLYGAALKIMPSYVKCHINLGLLYLSTGEKAKAISHWKEALEIDPANAEARQLLATYNKDAR